LNLYIVGLPDSGKTSLGIRLSHALGVPFIDLAEFIGEREKIPPEGLMHLSRDLFSLAEESALRVIDSTLDRCIVATCGLTVATPQNEALLSDRPVLYVRRASNDLLGDGSLEARQRLRHTVQELYGSEKKLLPIFERIADFTVENGSSLKECEEKVLALINSAKERSSTKEEGEQE